jgi:hypothetical protein
MTDYGNYIARSNGRLTEDEAFLLQQVMRFGRDAYPINKLQPRRAASGGGRGWTWGPVRGIKGPPTVFKTKRAAVASFEAYLAILRDKLAGRME